MSFLKHILIIEIELQNKFVKLVWCYGYHVEMLIIQQKAIPGYLYVKMPEKPCESPLRNQNNWKYFEVLGDFCSENTPIWPISIYYISGAEGILNAKYWRHLYSCKYYCEYWKITRNSSEIQSPYCWKQQQFPEYQNLSHCFNYQVSKSQAINL